MRPLIQKLRAGLDLNAGDVGVAVAQLFSDSTADDEKVEFLATLHRKGETAEEIVFFVQQLIDRSVDPSINSTDLSGPMVDICGTGGDGVDLFNVSTVIMFILAAGGAVVVKHGNHCVTSQCGSADVLKELGIAIDLLPGDLKECVNQLGLCFIHARQYHPAYRMINEMWMRIDRPKVRTIFNLLGPLLNPARPSRQMVGVYSPRLTGIIAEVLRRLGRERAWVVHGTTETSQGIDDISISGATVLAELVNGKVATGVIDPRWLSVPGAPLTELRGGNAKENAANLEGLLSGEIRGARRNLAVVNAAGGFVVAGLAHDMREGIALAGEQIDTGRALKKLRQLQQFRGEKAVETAREA